MRKWMTGLVVIAAATSAGCYQVQDRVDEQLSTCRNHHLAKMAWCRCRGNYVDCQDNLWDFGAGFRAGYEEILNGGKGCPPPIAPRSYWCCCVSGGSDPCAVAAWFDGFQHGVAAAHIDGYGRSYSAVPSSVGMYGQCCRRPVQIDLEQYKASLHVSPAAPGGVVETIPLPTDPIDPGYTPPAEPAYSPRTIEAPSDPTLAPEAPMLPLE